MPFIDHDPPPPPACRHPEHNPPGAIALPAGRHTWQCPGCGDTQIVTILETTLSVSPPECSADRSSGPSFRKDPWRTGV